MQLRVRLKALAAHLSRGDCNRNDRAVRSPCTRSPARRTITAAIPCRLRRPPRVRAITASHVVSMLKREGTPRHACSVTNAVSSTQPTVNAPRSVERARLPRRRNDATHTMVISVTPNDSPNVAALRSDSGPCHVPPPMTRIARWISPLPTNSTPTTYPTRSTVRSRCAATPSGCRRQMVRFRPIGVPFQPLRAARGGERRREAPNGFGELRLAITGEAETDIGEWPVIEGEPITHLEDDN